MPFQQHEQTGLVWFTADVLNDVPHGFSTRKGGVSPAPWDSLNLRPGQGDGPEKLWENYRRFFRRFGPGRDPCGPQSADPQPPISAPSRQRTPGRVCSVPGTTQMWMPLITNVPNLPLTVFSADCGTVLLYDPVHQAIGAVHRRLAGLCAGIVEKTVAAMVRPMGAVPPICWQRWVPASAPAASRQTEMCRRPCKPHWERMPTPISRSKVPNSM